MDTNLGNIIKNDKARQIIYAAWFIAGILIGVTQVVYSDPDPDWLNKTFAAWSYLGVPIAALATANSASKPNVVYTPAIGTVNTDTTILNGPSEDSTPQG
jgi:hypothetical protein